MYQGDYTILSNKPLNETMMEMRLSGDTAAITAPGQFVNIKLDGFFLRRPISICDWDENGLTILYKIVGGGTQAMADRAPGQKIDMLTGLGNGFKAVGASHPLLIGGGAGVPPMYALAKHLLSQGASPEVILGFNSAKEIFWQDEFERLGLPVHITTADGTAGTKGFVTDVMRVLSYDYFYTCGPMPMFKAIEKIAQTSGQYSFEERMGCGFGACMGCTCRTKYGNKRICKDGPVLEREEVIW